MVLARMAATAGFEPIVFRLSDSRAPSADSLRNQAWLQSGLRYAAKDLDLARLMWVYGRTLHEYLSLPVPTGRGLFQLATEDDARTLEQYALDIKVGQIDRLSKQEAARLLGEHHRLDGIVIATPEAPFNEGLLIQEAREFARAKGALFQEVSSPIQFLPRRSGGKQRMLIDGEIHEFGNVVLAAGAGNLPLLSSLGGQIGIKLRQTPLLVIPGPPSIKSPILLDRPGGFSLIAHAPGTSRPDGCMIFGADVHEDVDFTEPKDRVISPLKKQELLDSLPDCMKNWNPANRLTAGVEVFPVVDGTTLPTVRPYVEFARDCPGVVVAMPGRATLALYAAEQVMAKLAKVSDLRSSTSADLNGPTWDRAQDVHMHHESYYDHLNDS